MAVTLKCKLSLLDAGCEFPGQNVSKLRAGRVTQVAEHLPSNHEPRV
jgi:hypothetical protein